MTGVICEPGEHDGTANYDFGADRHAYGCAIAAGVLIIDSIPTIPHVALLGYRIVNFAFICIRRGPSAEVGIERAHAVDLHARDHEPVAPHALLRHHSALISGRAGRAGAADRVGIERVEARAAAGVRRFDDDP